jgi:hypothetical protein
VGAGQAVPAGVDGERGGQRVRSGTQPPPYVVLHRCGDAIANQHLEAGAGGLAADGLHVGVAGRVVGVSPPARHAAGGGVEQVEQPAGPGGVLAAPQRPCDPPQPRQPPAPGRPRQHLHDGGLACAEFLGRAEQRSQWVGGMVSLAAEGVPLGLSQPQRPSADPLADRQGRRGRCAGAGARPGPGRLDGPLDQAGGHHAGQPQGDGEPVRRPAVLERHVGAALEQAVLAQQPGEVAPQGRCAVGVDVWGWEDLDQPGAVL